jgi:hypothetical protein
MSARPTQLLWGISEIATLDGPQSFAMSFDDFETDVASADDVLQSLGVARGDSVLAVSTFAESGVYAPVFEAAWRRGIIVSCAEATAADAYRVALLIRVLPRLRSVVGINDAVLDGLAAAEQDISSVFAGEAVVAARPSAWARLPHAGVPARLWVHLGPALGVECTERAGAHIASGWHIDSDAEGILTINAATERACGVQRWRAEGRWSRVAQPCACGRTTPRVVARDANDAGTTPAGAVPPG